MQLTVEEEEEKEKTVNKNLTMSSWKKSITSPFRKACTFFNQPKDHHNKSHLSGNGKMVMDLDGEVRACGYEDVQVMWSILDKSKSSAYNLTS